MNGELLKDLNLLIQYLGIMRDTDDIEELDRYHSMIKKKVKEIYRGKREFLKEEKKANKKNKAEKKPDQ